MSEAYISVGALRFPTRPATAPAEIARGSANAAFGLWQVMHPCPTGSESPVSTKILLPTPAAEASLAAAAPQGSKQAVAARMALMILGFMKSPMPIPRRLSTTRP